MSIVLHLGIAAAVTAALAATPILTNVFVAFGAGAAAPIIVRKAALGAIKLLPPEGHDGQQPHKKPGDQQTQGRDDQQPSEGGE